MTIEVEDDNSLDIFQMIVGSTKLAKKFVKI
jgi:hypothetical protein